MQYFSLVILSVASAQKLGSLGTSGGSGPVEGIGTAQDPVTSPQSFITDALIPAENASARQLSLGEAPVLLDSYPNNPNSRNVTVDTVNGARQEMVGFGHAWTDSSVSVFNTLDDDVLEQVLKDLFSAEGSNMGMMRHTIGSSDLSYDQYSYDDNGPGWNSGEVDLNLSSFDIGYNGRRMADMIAKMGDYKGDVTLFGSPWSTPGWMKRNGLFIAENLNLPGQGNYAWGNNSFNFNYIPQYAQYFAKYIDAFKARGVRVNAITPQNEPLTNQGGYPTMWLDPVDEANLAQALHPLLQERNVGNWAYDHNVDQPVYPQRVIEGARGAIQAAAWHCYAQPVSNWSILTDFHYANPDLLQFMTECSTGLPGPGTWSFKIANAFMGPVQHYASGATMWVLATNPDFGPHCPFGGCSGCSGSIIVNGSRNYTKTQTYFMVGQFSRFIRRGSINYNIISGNVGNSFTSTQFNAVAVKNPDSSWAVVFLNDGNGDQEVALQFTDDQRVWSGTVPNGTVTTWLLPPLPPLASKLTSSSSYSTLSSTTTSATLATVPNITHTLAPSGKTH